MRGPGMRLAFGRIEIFIARSSIFEDSASSAALFVGWAPGPYWNYMLQQWSGHAHCTLASKG